MTDRLLALLEKKPVVMGDGAMGTMLQRAGLTDGSAPELWNLTRPEEVQRVHQGYLDAGSDFITTNSFGGNRLRLKLHGLEDRAHEISKIAAALAREVAGDDRLVAGSIGPTGELIEPLGTLTAQEAQEAFQEQAVGLADGGVDFYLIETMSALEEVGAAIEGCRQAADLPVVVTMTFDTNFHTMMGVSPALALRTLRGWGIQVIGANCGNGPSEIERIMWEMSQVKPPDVVLVAQSNAGLPRWEDGHISYDGTPEVMADYAQRMRALGVRVIGACCGSTPEHMARMREALEGPPMSDYHPPSLPEQAAAGGENAPSRRSARPGRRSRSGR